jgi:hypothetical protein
MTEKDPLAQRLDDAERQKRAERESLAKAQRARADDLQWLVDQTPAAYDEFARDLKARIVKISADMKDSTRRFSWTEDASRDFVVNFGQDSVMDVGYATGNPSVVAPQIQTTLRPTSYKRGSGVRNTFDPMYDAGVVSWKSHGRVFKRSELIGFVLTALIDFDDNQRAEA